jgi:hypothetical protein
MRYLPVLAVISAALLLEGCGTTKTIALHIETKMVTGEHMSCIYHADNLYCGSVLIKAENIDKLQVMNRVVSVVQSEEKESDMKEGGAFSTRFPQKPKEYSLWNCINTGVADPAVQCALLREADQNLVAQQEQQIKLSEAEQEQRIKLNAIGEKKLQAGLTEQDVVAKCGPPIEQKKDSISHTIYFHSGQAGQNVEVRFSTLNKPTQLDHIESVQDNKAHEFIPSGILWSNFSNIGRTDEEHVADIRKYFPCVLR